MTDSKASAFCAWCRRWERNGQWVLLGADQPTPVVVTHAICPECFHRVTGGAHPARDPAADADDLGELREHEPGQRSKPRDGAGE
jgi:hypothetical protein